MNLTSYKKEEETGIQVFNFEGSKVRTLNLEGQPWFVAVDVCNVLELGNSRMATAKLDDDEKMTVSLTDGHSGQRGGAQSLSIINEPGLYSLTLSSRKPQAKAFKRWITHEVVPAIRKYGAYAVADLLKDPDALITALTAYKEEQEKNRMLRLENSMKNQQIAEMKPKVSYYDYVLKSEDLVPISWIAKDYGMSAVTMNLLLAKLGVQFNQSGVWLLYQKYAERGYTHSSTFAFEDSDGRTRTRMTTKWTQSGRLFLYNLLKENGILPVMERTASKGGSE